VKGRVQGVFDQIFLVESENNDGSQFIHREQPPRASLFECFGSRESKLIMRISKRGRDIK